jgi:hypothetical protein
MTHTNREGRYNDEEVVKKQVDEQPEQSEIMVDISLEGVHEEKKNVGDGGDSDSNWDLDPEYEVDEVVETQQYEKPEEKDVEDDADSIFDLDAEYDEDEVEEKLLYDAPRLEEEEIEARAWKMKAGTCFVHGDGLDEAEDPIMTNEQDMVREDFALINWEDSKTEEALPEVTEKVLKTEADCQEAVIDTGGFHAYVAGNKVNFCVDIIPGELPFLISLLTMRERGFINDCEKDTVSLTVKTGMVIAPVRVDGNGHHYWLTLEHE